MHWCQFYIFKLLNCTVVLLLQILPNGKAWIPSLVKEIIGVATNGNKSIVVDKKLLEGSESNDRGKVFIPLILGVQVKVLGFLN